MAGYSNITCDFCGEKCGGFGSVSLSTQRFGQLRLGAVRPSSEKSEKTDICDRCAEVAVAEGLDVRVYTERMFWPGFAAGVFVAVAVVCIDYLFGR